MIDPDGDGGPAQFTVYCDTFSSPEPVVSWSRGRETRGSATGRLQIKPSGCGDENVPLTTQLTS